MASKPLADPAGPAATQTSLGRNLVVLAGLVDVVVVVVFAATGRGTHGHGLTPGQVLSTAWPFLAGTGIGWLVCRAWTRPTAVVTGVIVWAFTWAVGMVLRLLTGQGTAPAFVLVAAGVLLVLPAWRLVLTVLARRRLSPDPSSVAG